MTYNHGHMVEESSNSLPAFPYLKFALLVRDSLISLCGKKRGCHMVNPWVGTGNLSAVMFPAFSFPEQGNSAEKTLEPGQLASLWIWNALSWPPALPSSWQCSLPRNGCPAYTFFSSYSLYLSSWLSSKWFWLTPETKQSNRKVLSSFLPSHFCPSSASAFC